MNIASTFVSYGQYKLIDVDHDQKKGQKNPVADGMGGKNGDTSSSINIARCGLKNDKATVFNGAPLS